MKSTFIPRQLVGWSWASRNSQQASRTSVNWSRLAAGSKVCQEEQRLALKQECFVGFSHIYWAPKPDNILITCLDADTSTLTHLNIVFSNFDFCCVDVVDQDPECVRVDVTEGNFVQVALLKAAEHRAEVGRAGGLSKMNPKWTWQVKFECGIFLRVTFRINQS